MTEALGRQALDTHAQAELFSSGQGSDHGGELEATRAAALARVYALQPAAYARTRNALDGAVSGLSPYITHGIVTLPEVLAGVLSQHALDVQHKFVFELGWREFFRHVWQQRGDGILQSLHPGVLPDAAYSNQLPDDISAARTGVPVIDRAVRTLYTTGLLHNHARMWLASYVVHLRKVHWRTGADWMVGHLLDGDLASNHLSWQWVAATGSRKPYLFNADNVMRYAGPAWHSPGTLLDTDYGTLERLAQAPAQATAQTAASTAGAALGLGGLGAAQPLLYAAPPLPFPEGSPRWRLSAPNAAAVQGRDVWLVHPWSLGALPADLDAEAVVLGLLVNEFHSAWPWAAKRWRFVGCRMDALCHATWAGPADQIGLALAGARRVRAVVDPHVNHWLQRWAQCASAPALFAAVDGRCDSFSKWWLQASRGVKSAAELLHRNAAGTALAVSGTAAR